MVSLTKKNYATLDSHSVTMMWNFSYSKPMAGTAASTGQIFRLPVGVFTMGMDGALDDRNPPCTIHVVVEMLQYSDECPGCFSHVVERKMYS